MVTNNNSKAPGKPPITQHPLFPATVALWFGALFGLGSLAIRPALIEAVIVALKIDAVFAAVAPPLGATTRILLALALAGLGGLLGAWLARRLGRPKAATVARKRGAGAVNQRKSINTAEQRVGRRTRLAMTDETASARTYVDRAPLPGGATILDVSQFDLEGFEKIDEQEERQRQTFVPTVDEQQVNSDLDLSSDVRSAADTGNAQIFRPTDEARQTERAVCNDEPSAPAFAPPPHDFLENPPPFAASEPAVEACDGPSAANDSPFAASARVPDDIAKTDECDADPGPGLLLSAIHDQETAQSTLDSADIADDSADSNAPFEEPKPRPGSIFDRPPAAGLFNQQQSARVDKLGWNIEHVASKPAVREPATPAQATVTEPETEAEPVTAPIAAPDLSCVPDEIAAQRIAAAAPEDLSHVELLERLAISMRRKREHDRSKPAPAETQPSDAAEQTDPPANLAQAIHEDIAVSQPPVVEEAAETASVDLLSVQVPVIPAALRPIGLDFDDDAELAPHFVPPRHFAAPLTGNADLGEERDPLSDTSEAAAEQANALDEGYSSLLDLSRPGTGPQRFVRIEEPEPLATEFEPAVVYPGQKSRGSGPFDKPVQDLDEKPVAHVSEPEAATTAASDPDTKGQSFNRNGSAAPFAPPADRQDPAETDRALRAALASIQRMSGAA